MGLPVVLQEKGEISKINEKNTQIETFSFFLWLHDSPRKGIWSFTWHLTQIR